MLTQESDHYVPALSSAGNFFKKINLAMKLKWDELKEQKRQQQAGK